MNDHISGLIFRGPTWVGFTLVNFADFLDIFLFEGCSKEWISIS